MDTFKHMRVFVAVAEARHFAAAARKLSMSAPAVTRAVSQLEEHLGVKLLKRSTRQVVPTDAGIVYLENARAILDDVETANAMAAGVGSSPSGELRVTAPILFGRQYVLPSILQYLNTWPETNVDAAFLDRVVNMFEEGIDVAVRIGKLPDSSMRAIRVGSVRIILCAAPDYLKAHGIPQSPADLSNHQLISSRPLDTVPEWRLQGTGASQVVRLKPRLTVSSNDAAIAAAQSGFGITRLISYQAAPALIDGSLKTLLENFEPAPMPVHVLHREDRLASAKVRNFINILVENLRSDPVLN